MAAGKRRGGGEAKGRRGVALAGRERARAGDGGGSGASLPPSGSHSNRPLRMTLQAGPALRKRGGLRAQRRKGGAAAALMAARRSGRRSVRACGGAGRGGRRCPFRPDEAKPGPAVHLSAADGSFSAERGERASVTE